MAIVNTEQILSTHSLERPKRFEGSTVWVRIPTTEVFREQSGELLKHTQRLDRHHWKERTHTEPIRMNVYVPDGRQVWTAAGRDAEIEALEELIDLVGMENVKVVSPGRVDPR